MSARKYTPEQRLKNAADARAWRAARTKRNASILVGGELLGGAVRTSTRPRGFLPSWKPIGNNVERLAQVRQVIEEYRAHLPLTIRQIFYRLVGRFAYPKEDLAYMRLVDMLNRARRSRTISMDVIRDGGATVLEPTYYDNADDFIRTVLYSAERLQLDRTKGQGSRLVVMCEAEGMAPQLARVANPFGIPVIPSGGFDSVTEKHRLAKDLASDGRPTQVLHIGDHDPGGAHIFLSLLEDVEAFVRELGGNVTFTRIAITPDQIKQYNLPADGFVETRAARDEPMRPIWRTPGM